MRHRVFVETITPRVVVEGEEFHHSVRVVRVRAGEEIELFDRAGNAARGTVAEIDRDRAVIVAGEPVASRESPLAIDLAMAIIQLEKFELVLQKATELGVRSLLPLVTDRIEMRAERYAGKRGRWERIVFEAVKQSGRTAVPRLEDPITLEHALARSGTKIVFDADREPTPPGETGPLTVFIGPEGGWSEGELLAAAEAGVCFQRLGPRRLRAETAAIVAIAVMGARLGDL